MLGNKYFTSLRDENDEPIYTYTDPFMRNCVRKSIKGGRCTSFNQYYKSKISYEVFIIISKELNVKGNICAIFEMFFEFLSEHEKHNAKEFDSKYDDYKDINQEEKTEYIKKNLTCHQFIKNCLN